jgi:hypothetical protein
MAPQRRAIESAMAFTNPIGVRERLQDGDVLPCLIFFLDHYAHGIRMIRGLEC